MFCWFGSVRYKDLQYVRQARLLTRCHLVSPPNKKTTPKLTYTFQNPSRAVNISISIEYPPRKVGEFMWSLCHALISPKQHKYILYIKLSSLRTICSKSTVKNILPPAYMCCFSIISQQEAFPSIFIHWFPSNCTLRIMGSQVTGGN